MTDAWATLPVFGSSFNASAIEDIRQSLAVKQRLEALVPPFTQITAWSNNWIAYGSGFGNPGYTKGVDGIVRLQGLARRNSGTPATQEVITTLPAGYRPGAKLVFGVGSGDNATSITAGRVDVDIDGKVYWIAGAIGTVPWVSLQFNYRAEL